MNMSNATSEDEARGSALARFHAQNAGRYGFLIAATVGFLVALFMLWQTWLVFLDDRHIEDLAQVRRDEVRTLGELVAQTRKRVQDALANDAVTAPLVQSWEDGRTEAIAALRKALPDATSIELYRPDIADVLATDLSKFGYARSSLLLEGAHSQKLTAVQALSSQPGKRDLAFVAPVVHDQQNLAFVYLALPFEPVLTAFRKSDVSAGAIELHQVVGSGDTVLATLGEHVDKQSSDRGDAVADSAFRIASVQPRPPIVLPHNLGLLIPLTLLVLFGCVTLYFARLFGLRGALDRMMRRKSDEPTLEQTVGAIELPRPAPSTKLITRMREAEPEKAAPLVAVDRSIFRAYDIRGVLGKTLNAEVARLIGRAIGSEMAARGLKEIAVGRDGRLSGPELAGALIEGLRSTGADVTDIGAAPTPLAYFATYFLNLGSGVSVTGSHNPPDYNGFKIVLGGETLSEGAIQKLYTRIAEGDFATGNGRLVTRDLANDYVDRIASDVQLQRPLKVVVDCGNGIPGAIAPSVFKNIGAEVVPLYCEVDGNFPNHHPDPSDLHNLRDLIMAVKQLKADIGLAFDGDGDRLGVVTSNGDVIFPDRILMLFAQDVLSRNPGATIIYDVKCTGKLAPQILQHAGVPLMWRTGHSLIKAKMRDTDAALAGEMSGHFFFKERWFGFDDGIYAGARLLEILAGDLDGRDPQAIFDELPNSVSTPELKIEMAEGEHYDFIDRFQKVAKFEGARITTIDGVRADWPDGWGLVRASNTTPVLVLRFDADTQAALKRIQDLFRAQILAINSKLKLPF
jgi:phosphomannomutase/phosphoglucomutase